MDTINKNITVGQSCFLVEFDLFRGANFKDFIETKISKIGNKYITVDYSCLLLKLRKR